MTESEFAAAMRSMHRETEAERSARLDPVAHELEVEQHVDFYTTDRWNIYRTTPVEMV